MIINMLSTYTRGFTRFEIVVYNIFYFWSVLDLDYFRRCVHFITQKRNAEIDFATIFREWLLLYYAFSTFD